MKSLVGVIMGSTSDWETMKYACDILDELNIPYEKKLYLLIGLRIICLNMQRRLVNVG